jgi:Holliday junction resolvase RusA-like endonuclease
MAKARAAKAWRLAAVAYALDVLEALPFPWEPLSEAEVSVVFIVPDNRRRDWDNAIAARKPLMDGLVDAGVLTDDSNRVVKRLSYGFVVQPGMSGTVIRVESFRTE